ncbi:MAG: replication initiation protein [Phycisphaerales bacterium]|nr:replication initiation protein [Phycisphaerales bacterium]
MENLPVLYSKNSLAIVNHTNLINKSAHDMEVIEAKLMYVIEQGMNEVLKNIESLDKQKAYFPMRFNFEDLKKYFDESIFENGHLQSAVYSINKKRLFYNDADNKGTWCITPFPKTYYNQKEGYFEVNIMTEILELFLSYKKEKGLTYYSLSNMMKFKKGASQNMYKMLCEFQNNKAPKDGQKIKLNGSTNEYIVPEGFSWCLKKIEDFRFQMNCGDFKATDEKGNVHIIKGKYTEFKTLKRNIIDIAIKDINENLIGADDISNHVQLKTFTKGFSRDGKTVVGLLFIYRLPRLEFSTNIELLEATKKGEKKESNKEEKKVDLVACYHEHFSMANMLLGYFRKKTAGWYSNEDDYFGAIKNLVDSENYITFLRTLHDYISIEATNPNIADEYAYKKKIVEACVLNSRAIKLTPTGALAIQWKTPQPLKTAKK